MQDLKVSHSSRPQWIYLALDRDHCQALVNTARNLLVPLQAANFLPVERLQDFQAGLCFMQLVISKRRSVRWLKTFYTFLLQHLQLTVDQLFNSLDTDQVVLRFGAV